MIRRFLGIVLALGVATNIFLISVFKNASIKYAFNGPGGEVLQEDVVSIEYNLAYPGKILPDHPAWPVKALRDKLILLVSPNVVSKSELSLLMADKRIAAAQILFEKGKAEVGYSTLTKAEKYLEEAYKFENHARSRGIDTTDLLKKLSLASLKHMEIAERILLVAPDDAKPQVIKTMDYSRKIYEGSSATFVSLGIDPIDNPFNW